MCKSGVVSLLPVATEPWSLPRPRPAPHAALSPSHVACSLVAKLDHNAHSPRAHLLPFLSLRSRDLAVVELAAAVE